MKKQWMLVLTVIVGSAAAFALRLLENLTGFEAATGLPVPGNPARLALVVLLALLAVALLLLARQLPQESEPSFPAGFSTQDPRFLMLPVMGILLMGLSGLLDAAAVLIPEVVPGGPPSLSPRMLVIYAATALLPAVALFPAAAACREKETPRAVNGSLLLAAPVCLVVRLVLTYRLDSADPSLQAYYVELLALVFLTLGFYRLSSFAFQAGHTCRFALYAGAAVILSAAALADGGQLSSMLLYAGGALTLLGFVLLRLCHKAESAS